MSAPLDPTFRNYDAQQAAAYDQHRGTSSATTPSIIREVISQHAARGGKFNTVLDVGCGTGTVTRHLAPYFDNASGCDAGQEMIVRAAEAGGSSKGGAKVVYEVLDAEQLDQSSVIALGGADLLTVSMAAHWFHMRDFWAQAARVVKPGGTVAIWTMSSLYCHPATPNATAAQRALSHLEDTALGPFELPQNRLSRHMYADLALPWAVGDAAEFTQAQFARREWNRDGRLEAGEDDFFAGSTAAPLGQLAGSLGTASMVTRWREANPGAVGTGADCVAVAMAAVREALGGGGEGCLLRTGHATTLLLFTRSSTV